MGKKGIDSKIEAVKQGYENEIAKLKAELETVREESEAIGILKKIDIDRSFNDLIEAIVLYKIKENKSYKKDGMTWVEFCKAMGKECRNVDRIISDIRPIYLHLSDKMSGFIGIEFNKIRLLGKAISADFADFEDDSLIYEGEKIPLTPEHKEDIIAVIEDIQEGYKRKLKDQEKQAEKEKTRLEKDLETTKYSLKSYLDVYNEYRKMVPEEAELTDVQKQVRVAEGLYEAFERAMNAIIFNSIFYQAKTTPAEFEALLKRADSGIGIQIERWNLHQEGKEHGSY